MNEVEWGRLKAHELRSLAANDSIVIVPVAALEQHGPHLPVMVDSRLTGEVARRTAIRGLESGTSIVTLPVVWHGLSEHHMPYGGTVTLNTETFYLVIKGIISSVSRHGFSKVLILNGHGGNITAAEVCAQDISLDLGIPIIATTYWLEAEKSFQKILETQSNVLHAGEAETSMMMALEPELVEDTLLDEVKGPMDLGFLKTGNGSYRWRSLTHVTSNGVIGDPSRATKEKGNRLLDAAAKSILELLAKAETFAPQEDLRPDDPSGIPFLKS